MYAQHNETSIYSISDVGHISIPPTLELKGSKVFQLSESRRKANEDICDYFTYDDKVVFQQRGLNELSFQALYTYVRVIIETINGEEDSFYSLRDKYYLGESDLKEINGVSKKMIRQTMSASNMKLIEWFPVKQVVVNGLQAIKLSYIRQLSDSPLVYVAMYQFHNYDRLHTLTLSYRVNDESIWKHDLDTVLNSFTITNIR